MNTNELGIIFRASVAIAFLFAGLSKLLWIRDSSRFARDLGLFPKKVGAVLGFFMPIIELAVGIGMIFSNNPFISIVALGIIMFFVAINVKTVVEDRTLECFCYGNIIKTKLGQGGLVHYLFLLITLLISFITIKSNASSIFYEYTVVNQILISSIVLLIFINSIVIQLVLDKLSS